jgi:predicted nucleic acid-binding protein
MTPLPSWIKVLVAEPGATAGVEQLGQGERDAILIALKMTASLVFIDEAQGRKAAEKLGLIASGTRGILERAVRRSLIDGAETAARLKTAGFRASPRLLALLERPSAKPAVAHRKERSSS